MEECDCVNGGVNSNVDTTGTYIRRAQPSKASLWLTDDGGAALFTSQTPTERGYGYELGAGVGRGRISC